MADSKKETMMKLALCIFELEDSKGHLKWKVTDLVRKAKVSRPLVYRYFGSSKKGILLSALSVFIEAFYGFSVEDKGRPLTELVLRARDLTLKHPEPILFYQKWGAKKSWLSDEIRKIEKKFQSDIKKSFPHLTNQQVVLAHAFIHGIVTAPFVTSSEAKEIVQEFGRIFISSQK